MASEINRGESLLIPFRNGKSIYDSQCKPRMYKTRKGFEKHFPDHYLGKDGVELVEYAEVVRCGNCKYYVENHYGDIVCQHPEQDGDWLDSAWLNTNPDDFCSYGERKPE